MGGLSHGDFLRYKEDMISERNKTLAAFSIDNNGTKVSGIEDTKVWRPLNADIFEMKIKQKAKEQAHHHDAMTNRIGVL